MITYATYATGNTNIRFPEREDLVLGFMVEDLTARTEVLYALHRDGRVLRTNELQKPNNDFHKVGRKWTEVGEVPAQAEFIGHYQAPRP